MIAFQEFPERVRTVMARPGCRALGFRLWGSRRCRQMREYSTEARLFTWMVYTLGNRNASLSEGGALAVVVGDFDETPHQKRYNTDCPHLMRLSKARFASPVPPSPERGAGTAGPVRNA